MVDFEFPEDATPISDCSGLIPLWVHNLNDLNRVEAESIINAQRKYLRGPVDDPKKWFFTGKLKEIHRSMFEDVWEWAGAYRKSITTIGIKPNLIPVQLAEFCREVLIWLTYPVELTFLEMAARIHHRLVFIHPFENGNGRFSRLVSDRFLLSFKCPYPIWPNYLNQEGIIRKDYIQALKNADRGDYNPLINLMKKFGATDPKLSELLKNSFYQKLLKSARGPSLVSALLRYGENPNDETPNGHRSLQLAIKAGLDEIAKVLVSAGAEINAKDRSGQTPFRIAVNEANKNLADFLLSKGAKL